MRKKDEQASLGDERAIRDHPCCADDLSGETLWVKKKSLGKIECSPIGQILCSRPGFLGFLHHVHDLGQI